MTGLYLTVWPASVAVTAVVAGWLANRVATAGLCAAGAACMAMGLAGVAISPMSGGPLRLVPAIALGGVGFGLFQSPNNRTMFLSAPEYRSGAAGGMQGTARVSGQTAGALATALLFAVLPMAMAPRACLAIGAALALAASLASLWRHDAAPAATIVGDRVPGQARAPSTAARRATGRMPGSPGRPNRCPRGRRPPAPPPAPR